MPKVKVAICLEGSLLAEIDRLAKQEQVSRSAFLAEAVEAMIRLRRKQELLREIEEAYGDGPDEEERERREGMRRLQAKLAEGKW